MKISKVIFVIFGLFIPLLIGMSFHFPDGILLMWICLFFFGMIGKVLIQAFEKPFLNLSRSRKLPDHHFKILNFFSSAGIFLGIGALVGDILFFRNIGSLPVTLLIFGFSIHFGTYYTNFEKWFFNQ